MAKLTRLMNENIALRKQVIACSNAYTELLEKYRKLFTKHSYEEVSEELIKMDEIKKKDGKILWDNLKVKEESMIKEK